MASPPGPEAEPAGATLARYYDLDLSEDPGDLDLYAALADSTGGPVLELAAGSGRVAVPLAAAGHEVVAVDRDPHMLERARAHWEASGPAGRGSLDLVEADITSLRLDRRFGLVIVALNSLLMLDRGGQPTVLETIAAHLSAEGRAAIDVWLPAPDDLALYDGRLVLDWVRHDDAMGEWVAKSSAASYSSGSRTADITTFFDAWRDGAPARRTMRRDRIWFESATRVAELAERAGLSVDTLASDYEMGPFAEDSDRLVLICRPG